MAEDTNGWSEKGKSSGRGKRPARDPEAPKSATPSRPSKRETTDTGTGKESSVVRTPSGDAGARKVAKAAATAGQRDVSFASRMGFPAVIALVCLLGIGAVVFARSQREALASPVQNLDHWHSVYGVYNCMAEGGDMYLPPFQSDQDETGIHSHGDGIMHIHPFFELSSGDNAQIRHWIDEMNVEITPERISVQNQFDAPVELVAGTECTDGSGPAEIKMLHWDFDFQALADDRPDPEVFESGWGEIKFEHDREVYVWAFVGPNADLSELPIPPEARFDTLNNVSSAIEYEPEALIPQDSGIDVDGDEADADAEEDPADS